jgi:hypothetical protein
MYEWAQLVHFTIRTNRKGLVGAMKQFVRVHFRQPRNEVVIAACRH